MCSDAYPNLQTIIRLDHVNLRTCKLEDLKSFYVDVLGLDIISGDDTNRASCHLGSNGQAWLHLVSVPVENQLPNGRIEHFAFRAQRLGVFLNHLDELDVGYNLHHDLRSGTIRVNLRDPDENRLHVDFDASERQPGRTPRNLQLR